MLEDMPLVDGVARAVEAVHAAGGEAHIASLAWGVVAAYLCKRYGFDGYVGSELEMEDGVCTGGVALALEGEGKCAYARELCVSRGIDFDACIAIGDSRSDIPLFELVGTSVAFNATGEAERAATHVYRGTDIAEALAPGTLMGWLGTGSFQPIIESAAVLAKWVGTNPSPTNPQPTHQVWYHTVR